MDNNKEFKTIIKLLQKFFDLSDIEKYILNGLLFYDSQEQELADRQEFAQHWIEAEDEDGRETPTWVQAFANASDLGLGRQEALENLVAWFLVEEQNG